ncbi:3-oxoacyl-[acyl-carrier-protein] reductase [Cyphomyrmex costatus]|uniref:3-oxoacyl-[acyl-carrier-protein] reductase n=1 Tax=Cyphomyrmex costatus TaxID=456900 RepID=A0A195CSK8_9HYME|nr:3-oxoacyl-[acyl-carrier-protein] reductase [Cyphomyrmex costatus]
MSFKGKVVLITGASSGIGAETAIYLAQLGASLSITAPRNKLNLNKVAEQCGQPKPFIVTGDLANENDVKNIIDSTIKRYGKLDVLINNAGIAEFGTIETVSLKQYDNIMNVNVRSVFQLTTLAVPYLIKTKGNIVNVSSVAGLRPFKNGTTYSMSKAALDQFTRCVALELASQQVRVNSVNPGAVITDILRNTGMNQEQIKIFYEKMKGAHALGRIGDTLEIAKSIAFLASDDANVLINNAGITEFGTIETVSLKQYDNIMNVNVRSVFQLTTLAVPYLIKTKGNIVNISSVAGLRPSKTSTPYSMSKAALDQFTRCVALELASQQVRVNSVNPGAVITDILRNTGMNQEQIKIFYEKMKEKHALGRTGDTLEIAKSIAFLASDDASFITGVTIPVDGGLLLMSS